MDSMLEEFDVVTNILLHGYGSAVLGTVASISGQTITLNDDIWPTRNFYPGVKLDSYTNDTQAVQHDTGMVVQSSNRAARTVVVTGASTTAASDVLILSGCGPTVSPSGLLSAIDDGTYVPTINNVTRSTTPLAKSAVLSAAGLSIAKFGNATRQPLTEDIIQQGMDAQQDAAGARRAVDLIYSSLGVRRLYFAGLVGDRRFVNERVFDGGWKALRYVNGDAEAAWMANEWAMRYTAFLLYTGTRFHSGNTAGGNEGSSAGPDKPIGKIRDEETLAIYEAPWGGADWDDATGGQLKQVYSSTGALIDAVYAMLKWYFEFTSLRSNDFARIDDCAGG